MFVYDSESIRKKLQAVLSSKNGRRYALVAFVGQDATDFIRDPNGLVVYCWDNVAATHPDGVKSLIRLGATVYFVDRLHMKLFWSERGGVLLGSCNLTRNALRDGTASLREVAYFVADASKVAIDEVLEDLTKSRRLVTDAVLAAYRKKYNAAAARRYEFVESKAKTKTHNLYSFKQYVKHPADQPWSIACWRVKGKFGKAVLHDVRAFAKDEGVSRDPARFVAGAVECEGKPKVGEWILCCKVGKNNDFGRLDWIYTHLVSKPRKNSTAWDAVQVKKQVESPPFDCKDERFRVAFKKYGEKVDLLERWTFTMTAKRLARMAALYSS